MLNIQATISEQGHTNIFDNLAGLSTAYFI